MPRPVKCQKCVVAAADDAMKANAKWPCLLTVLLWFALYKGIFKAGDLLFEKPRIVVATAPRWWWKPPPNASACNTFEHTEMGGGTVVAHPPRLVDSAHACCAACAAHNSAEPRPRGRVNCTTWVWNSDASHAQARECWLKRHDSPWQDIQLLAGGARSWTTGIAVPPPKVAAGVAPTTRSCADAKAPLARLLDSAAAAPVEAYQHRAVPHVHGAEESFCPPVAAHEASVAIEMGDERVRIRLNRATSPQATAWIDSVIDHGACANASRRVCDPHCCNFYRGEAVVGYHRLPDALLRAHSLDPARLPSWGREYWWGPPYAFIQGRLWHGGPGPWKSDATKLPSEGTLPTLHRGTVELVGGGPDFLIALADHPMMPPHNVFGHVVEEDMAALDRLIERGPLKSQNWGTINATVFERAVPFALRRIGPG